MQDTETDKSNKSEALMKADKNTENQKSKIQNMKKTKAGRKN